jgi:hypothetical protein
MVKNSFHVIATPKGGWAVKKRGASRASKRFDSKESAIIWGKKISKDEGAEFVVHGRDGMITSRDSYDSEPGTAPNGANRK